MVGDVEDGCSNYFDEMNLTISSTKLLASDAKVIIVTCENNASAVTFGCISTLIP